MKNSKEIAQTSTSSKHVISLTFEGISLSCPIENGHRMIPVRTVCKIIDVDFKKQDSSLKKHPFFAQLYTPRATVGADNKERKMNCLGIFDIDGWLHSIGAKGRKPGSIKKQYAFLSWLREQKLGLYKSIDLFVEENKYELELVEMKDAKLTELLNTQNKVKKVKKEIHQLERKIEDVRVNRFTGQTALPFNDN